MRLECVEAFADAAVRALVATFGTEFGAGEPRLAGSEERPGGITVHVRFSGEQEGRVALNVDEVTALRLYSRATGEAATRLPELGVDFFLELCNVISGGAVSRLNELGYDVRVAPPELVTPGGATASEPGEACQIAVFSVHGGVLLQVVTCAA